MAFLAPAISLRCWACRCLARVQSFSGSTSASRRPCASATPSRRFARCGTSLPRSGARFSIAFARWATQSSSKAKRRSCLRRGRKPDPGGMRIFRHFDDVPDGFRGGVVAIGNFDGVHLGHQALMGEARRLAAERNTTFDVLAFEPHPQEFFHPGAECFRLTPFRTKARLMAAQGADAMFALAFDAEMAAKSAQDFIMDVLIVGLGAGAVTVGADFQFGKRRAGNPPGLSYWGARRGL